MAGLFYHDVLSALTAARIPFVIVGGLAVNLQGVPRFTSDLDVAVALEGPGLAQAAAVLRGLGLRCRLPVREEELERTADRLTAAGLTLCVASIPALVRMKTGTGRAQDASDVEALHRVEALRGR